MIVIFSRMKDELTVVPARHDVIDGTWINDARRIRHVKVSDTYWYITGIPELMNIASALFNDNPFLKEQPL